MRYSSNIRRYFRRGDCRYGLAVGGPWTTSSAWSGVYIPRGTSRMRVSCSLSNFAICFWSSFCCCLRASLAKPGRRVPECARVEWCARRACTAPLDRAARRGTGCSGGWGEWTRGCAGAKPRRGSVGREARRSVERRRGRQRTPLASRRRRWRRPAGSPSAHRRGFPRKGRRRCPWSEACHGRDSVSRTGP